MPFCSSRCSSTCSTMPPSMPPRARPFFCAPGGTATRSAFKSLQGLELLRRFRDQGVTAPVIVLSSRGDEAGKVQALDLGADDYVTKPFGLNELLARMRAAIRHRLQCQGERP